LIEEGLLLGWLAGGVLKIELVDVFVWTQRRIIILIHKIIL
jgi:hypothetical protein